MLSRPVIVMPAYQAAATIEGVPPRIPPAVAARLARLIVVDDGSRDDTWSTIARLAAADARVLPLRHETNRGYGGALKTLLRAALTAGADGVVVLHADGQYAPESLPGMLAPLDAGEADLVQGSRLLGGGALAGGMPRYKYIANRALTWIENRAFGLQLAEYHSGYMAYSRRFLEAARFDALSESFDFDLEMIAVARAGGYRIHEIPIPTHYGDEVSHLRSIPYGLRVLRVVTRYLRGKYG
ncbi:MAG: glycosyltransferase family 2 protein [Kiritimatiellae bacterium]|nr:glycosyltransferase family 2 protein [Kiritimatiellia bacterium]